ncbi:MAG: hypothetical protein ACI8V5_004155 [Limisphaerales bacterium]
MIVVMADDISGAAELAGVAFERGLSAEVQTRFDPTSTADVVALDTDSRLATPAVAARRVGEMARHVAAANPSLIYKKVDSVLRGAIVAEIDAILESTGRTQALLVPANPSRRRLIKVGEYFVEGVPLADTGFANDPTHPAWTSNVLELLGPSAAGGTTSVRANGGIFERGITIPDVGSVKDLKRRAMEVDENILPAGGAEFFGAILDLREGGVSGASDPAEEADSFLGDGGTLIVCGSAAAWAHGRGEKNETSGMPSFAMAPELAATGDAGPNQEACARWAFDVWTALQEHGVATIAIGLDEAVDSSSSEKLLARLVDAVEIVLRKASVHRLLLEGGATARAVIDRKGWSAFTTVGAIEGLSWLRVGGEENPVLLIKPGSYRWPSGVVES